MSRMNYTYKPQYWRFQAEELRAKAEEMMIPHCKQAMMLIAEQYDELARNLEHELRVLLKSSDDRSDNNVTQLGRREP